MDEKVLQEKYNTTRNDFLQFVLSRSYGGSYFVICLIWTMPKTYHLSSDLNYEVSYCLVPIQKNSRRRQLLQKFTSLFKAEPVYEGRLKVILLLQVSSDDFEPTFIIFCHVTSILVCCIFAANTAVFC